VDYSIFESRAELAKATAALIAERAAAGPMTLGLAGGSTPSDAYKALENHDVAWDRISLWLSDERWVAHDDPDSNGRMALECLPADAAERLVRPRYSSFLDPADSAAHYEAELRSMHEDRPPDLVLLGMGTDGHTASLFPGTAALDPDPHRWFVANHVPQVGAWRLTVTPNLLKIARRIVVLVSGPEKAGVLAEVLEGQDGRYPIQLLHQAEGEVTVMCDREAASALSG
jgi:6-phosphogluconolactonase